MTDRERRGLATSERVPIDNVGAITPPNSGKAVTAAFLCLEERHGPTPPRRVVTIKTDDGATYRFQRYTTQERLVFYDRESPSGDAFQRAARLPEHVDAVRDAIQAGAVTPDPRALADAQAYVANDHARRATGLDDARHAVGPARTDGGERE